MSVEETKNCLVMSAAPCCCSISVEKKDKSDVCGLVVIYLSRNYITSFKLYTQFAQFVADVVLLLGNDYCPRIKKNGVACVFQGSLPTVPKGLLKEEATVFKKQRIRKDDSMLDMLSSSDNPIQWIVYHGLNGKKPMPIDHVPIFLDARKYMMHAPVLRRNATSGATELVPLNPLADGIDIGEYLKIPDLRNLTNDAELLAGSLKEIARKFHTTNYIL